MAFKISTNAFVPGGNIPVNFTREGANKSPLVRWEGAPEGTRSFALIVEDPDAPGAPYYHWLVYDIPANVHELMPELAREQMFPDGTKQGVNDFGEVGWDGPQPPAGEKHQYVFRLYALKEPPGLIPGMRKDELLSRLEESIGVLERTEITGFYKNLAKKKKTVA